MEPAMQRPELMPGKPGRLVLGIAASIVAHAILLLAYRIESLPGITAEDVPPVESLVILVKPKPPEPPPVTRAEPVTKPAASRAVARANTIDKEEQQDTEVAETVVAVEPTSLPDPFYMPQAPKEKRFDMDAARAAARRIATAPDPARAGLPVAQFDKERDRVKPQLTKSERAIAEAARPDCKDGIPGLFGGLLSPINLLMDKKDHGCKW